MTVMVVENFVRKNNCRAVIITEQTIVRSESNARAFYSNMNSLWLGITSVTIFSVAIV